MPGLKRYLLFTLDTEPDDPSWRGLEGRAWTHENLRGLARLAECTNRLGVKTTFLLSHSVVGHSSIEASLAPFLREGSEAGTHLHPGDTPPFGAWDDAARDNILRLPDAILEEKFATLQMATARRFGPVRSYRSGSWVLDGRVVGLLRKYGFRVDSSVTPGVSWRLNGRPSYLRAPMRAYRLDAADPCRPGRSGVLEVPVTIWSPRKWDGEGPAGWLADVFTLPLAARKGPLAGSVRLLRPPPPRWLRPAFMDVEQMEEVARSLQEVDYLHVMCHSNELWPGASPYVSDEAGLDALYARLEGIFRRALDLGYTPVTLAGYADCFDRGDAGHPAPVKRPRVSAGSAPAPPAAAPAVSLAPPAAPPAARPARHSGLALGFKAAVSAAALFAMFSLADLDVMRRHLGQVQAGWLLACLAALLAEIGINCLKMAFLAEPQRISKALLFRVNLVKMFFNNVLPGGMGGEAARMFYLAREMGSWGRSTGLVFWDRLSGLWSQILFSMASLPVAMAARWDAWAAGMAVALILPWSSLRWGHRLFAAQPPAWTRLAGEKFLAQWRQFRIYWEDLALVRGRTWRLAAYSVAGQLSMMLALYLAAAALGGSLSPWRIAPIMLLGTLSSLLPISLGGLGVSEGAYALGFAWLGADPELGFLVALLVRALSLLPALAGGALLWAEKKRASA